MSQTVRTILLTVVFAGMGGGVAYQRFFHSSATKAKGKTSDKTAKKTVTPIQQPGLLDSSPVKAERDRSNSTAAPEKVTADEAPPANSTEQTPAPAIPKEISKVHLPVAPADDSLRGILFSRLDKNQDGAVEGSELPERFRTGLLAADGDKSGKLDEREFSAGVERLRSDPASTTPSAEPRSVGPLLTPPPPGQSIPVYVPKTTAKQAVPNWFRERDKNDDGQIGLYEWPSDKADEFKRLDENGDGFITSEEADLSEKAKRPSR